MASTVHTLLSGATGTGAGSALNIYVPANKTQVPYVIRGITTATVAVQGSLDGTNWLTLATQTADAASVVFAFPYMRANVTAYTSGTITVEILADEV